jgi:hypothetical protein
LKSKSNEVTLDVHSSRAKPDRLLTIRAVPVGLSRPGIVQCVGGMLFAIFPAHRARL